MLHSPLSRPETPTVDSWSQPVPFVDLAAQYTAIKDEIDQAIAGVLKRSDFILGQEVAAFEEEFAAYCGVKHAVGVDSGLSALELLLRAYGVGPGDEVIVQANTFIATVLAVSSVGATPVLIDIEPRSYMLDLAQLEAAITPRTRAIIPVHLYGQIAEWDGLMAIAQRHRLIVIEDACQAHGARYKGRRAGSLGHGAAFSFYPAKNLGAAGDGGIAVTDDAQVAHTLRLLRNYGSTQKYHHEICGFNHRLDTLHAAVLRVKLRHLDSWNAARRAHASAYTRWLHHLDLQCPTDNPDTEPVYHLYVIRSAQRDALQTHLQAKGIATGIHYPVPIHLQPAYRHLNAPAGAYGVTEQTAKQILSLPMYAELPLGALHYVVETIAEYMHMPADTPPSISRHSPSGVPFLR
ncbi:MAG: DegT/DnrJ/EryC1/StrS family aminotransferase [Caldilineaceae bacterium]|nr:DegT/DnrJ/EryC1/StrS family aminotransferase [Caldilineaceae bacterium]